MVSLNVKDCANLFQAHIEVSASFSIWAYHCSVLLRASYIYLSREEYGAHPE